MTAFLDTNVLLRHMTGEPVDQARGATKLLASTERLLLPDLVVAEVVYVLQSFYELERARIADLLRTTIAFPSIVVLDALLLLRALELYERAGLHFAEAYLVASAEITGVGAVASFDRSIDGVSAVRRLEPAA